jgi:hypothetical protein
MTLTAAEYRVEYAYRLSERLGISIGAATPTEADLEAAREHVNRDMDAMEGAEV